MYIDFRGLGSFLTTTPAHKYDKDGKTTPPDTEIPTSILNEPVSESVSVKEKK